MSKFLELSNKDKFQLIFGANYNLKIDSYLKGQYNMDYDFSWVENISNNNKNTPNLDKHSNNEINDKNKISLFRVYGWEPYCLSLGYNQKDDKLNYEAINNLGYDVVRRPTGGRAVFHSNEITYSSVVDLNEINSNLIENGFLEFENEKNRYNHRDFYRDIHLILIEILSSLDNIGDKLDYSKKDTVSKHHYQTSNSVSCFSSSARYEVTHNSKKIVGSAQRLFGNVLLQHGSILLGREHLQILDLIKLDNEERNNLKLVLETSSISLSEIACREIRYNEVIDKINNFLSFN